MILFLNLLAYTDFSCPGNCFNFSFVSLHVFLFFGFYFVYKKNIFLLSLSFLKLMLEIRLSFSYCFSFSFISSFSLSIYLGRFNTNNYVICLHILTHRVLTRKFGKKVLMHFGKSVRPKAYAHARRKVHKTQLGVSGRCEPPSGATKVLRSRIIKPSFIVISIQKKLMRKALII